MNAERRRAANDCIGLETIQIDSDPVHSHPRRQPLAFPVESADHRRRGSNRSGTPRG